MHSLFLCSGLNRSCGLEASGRWPGKGMFPGKCMTLFALAEVQDQICPECEVLHLLGGRLYLNIVVLAPPTSRMLYLAQYTNIII